MGRNLQRWGLAVLAACCLAGCGAPLADPGRRSRAGPVLGPPPTAMPAATPAVTDANSLPHVPLSQLLPSTPASATAVYYEVQPGDTLSGIARRYRMTVGQLQSANGLNGNSVLKPGQLISIPGPG